MTMPSPGYNQSFGLSPINSTQSEKCSLSPKSDHLFKDNPQLRGVLFNVPLLIIITFRSGDESPFIFCYSRPQILPLKI